jgi:outer membrane protein assembly factor BamB
VATDADGVPAAEADDVSTAVTERVTEDDSTQMSRRQGWLLVGALLLLFVILFFVDFSPPIAESRQVEAESGFEPLLALQNVEMAFPPALGEETAVFIGTLTPGSNHSLTAIDITNGETKWEITGSQQIHPDYWPEGWPWQWPFAWEWGPVITLDNQVFVADAFLLTTTVNAFDLTTGEPGWQRAIGNVNGSSVGYLAAVGDEIALGIDVEGYSEFDILDAEQGFRQMRRMEDAGHIFWGELEPERIYEAFANQIRVTGENGWQQAISGCNAQPTMHPELIFVITQRCGEGEFAGNPGIFALARSNGALVWQLEQEIVSNLALDGNVLVGLTANANLLVIDAQSGAVVSQLPFAELQPNVAQTFFVGAHDGVTAVYFGDSQELIVLRYR